MTQLQDWPLRYGVILGKRFTEKQKIAFLRSLTKDFQELGYAVDTTKSYLRLAKKDPALAFVFFDGGATNGYGLQLLEDYLKGKKKVVFLEGLTDTELTETKAGKPYPETARYFTTKGAETSSLKLAGTRKDAAFDEALLEKHVETLLTYLH